MVYESLEAWWSTERLSGDKGLVRGRGICGINLSYDQPGQGGCHTLSVAKAEKKREVGANSKDMI